MLSIPIGILNILENENRVQKQHGFTMKTEQKPLRSLKTSSWRAFVGFVNVFSQSVHRRIAGAALQKRLQNAGSRNALFGLQNVKFSNWNT